MENDIHAQLLWQVLHIIQEHRNNAQTLADQLLFQNLLHEIVELIDEVEYGSGGIG